MNIHKILEFFIFKSNFPNNFVQIGSILLFLAILSVEDDRAWMWVGLGLATGLAALTNPVVLAVAPLAATWRFDVQTYARERGLGGASLRGPADLAHALADLREFYAGELVPVHEERLLPSLIADLAAAGAAFGSARAEGG